MIGFQHRFLEIEQILSLTVPEIIMKNAGKLEV